MKEIVLVQGGIALVDDEDFENLSQYKWHLHSNGYAVANHKNKKLRMHRLVINAQEGEIVDHCNRVRLDNQKHNLRITTMSGNACNRAPTQRKLPYKGVYRNAGKYEARIKVNRAPRYLGRFRTAEEAARAYNSAAAELHGEMAFLNVL